MKKLILPITLIFINLSILFIFVPSAYAVNLNGEWTSKLGMKVEAKQSGDTFTLTVTDTRVPEYMGVVDLKGKIKGSNFTGQSYYITDNCPNLTGYVAASGTISDEKIEVKAAGFSFDPDNCVKLEASEYQTTYTKTVLPSPIPAKVKKTASPSKQPEQVSIFAFNPLEIWRNIQGILDIEESFPSLLQSSQFLTELAEAPMEIPRPSIAFDPEGKPWDFLPGYIPHESIYLGNTMRISEGTNVSVGGVNQRSDKKLLNLEEGEVEVIKNEPDVTDSEYDGIKTPNATVLSVQTHYWVSYDKKKNQTAVVVYEGKVEVKTNDGQTTTISPSGDEPGVLIISQKLSPIKLGMVGVVAFTAAVGVITLFLKRRQKPSKKR